MNSIIILGSAFALTYLFVSTSQRVGRWADQRGLVPENYAASLVKSRNNGHRETIELAGRDSSAGPRLG
jgi:hypothetical protein